MGYVNQLFPPKSMQAIYSIRNGCITYYFCIDNIVAILKLKEQETPWFLEILDLFQEHQIRYNAVTHYKRERDHHKIETWNMPKLGHSIANNFEKFDWLEAFLKKKHNPLLRDIIHKQLTIRVIKN